MFVRVLDFIMKWEGERCEAPVVVDCGAAVRVGRVHGLQRTMTLFKVI